MIYRNFPYSPEVNEWIFSQVENITEFELKKDNHTNSTFFIHDKLTIIIEILFKCELLIPTYIQMNNNDIIGELPITHSQVLEFDFEQVKNNLLISYLNYKEKYPQSSLRRIGGYGVVYDEKNEKVICADLVAINVSESPFLNFVISTQKTLWVPFSIDINSSSHWQFELWINNSYRLTEALFAIYNDLAFHVSPDINEIDMEKIFWMKGFELFNRPDTLNNFKDELPIDIQFSIDQYLEYYMNNSKLKPTFTYK
jgi:hypothetical protein